MNSKKREFTINLGGKNVIIEVGRMAKQADGSVLVSSEGTQVLVTICSATVAKDGQDFFPLTVEYIEKAYAAGKFLGGFFKREAKPSTKETLNARLIDRPMRPLFPKGYMFETVVSATVLSYKDGGDPEVLAALGASAAVNISDIPFEKSIGTVKVGRVDGKFVINPKHDQWALSDMELVVSASSDAILMVEGEAKEVTEAEMLEAITFAHGHIKGFCNFLDGIKKEVGKAKREFVSAASNEKIISECTKRFSTNVRESLNINEKLERQKSVHKLEATVAKELEANFATYSLTEKSSFGKEAVKVVDEMLYKAMRTDILEKEYRIAGRKLNQVRPIQTEVDILTTPHGSSLFTRGETQVMATVTIGGSSGEQMSDQISGTVYYSFYLHYNFPPFSVGEAKSKFSVGRRELGHGNLAERALKQVLPSKEDFPYTVRIVCEVLESNGSSSMGSVCSGSMALMDAGVPIKSPVAGVAMGLVAEGNKFKILTDILGDEDHLGDMDFKVAGTKNGITAIQMDIKIDGLKNEIIEEALARAKDGRLHILGEMNKTVCTHRKELKDGVPRMLTLNIPVDKIGALIGPGGKNIKKLQESFGLDIEIEESGLVKIIGADVEKLNACLGVVDMQINGPEVGLDYTAVVVSIKDYGTFVDIAEGVSGLVHVSEIADERVTDLNDYVAVGDKIQVRLLEIDKMGRLKLSAKAVKSLPSKK